MFVGFGIILIHLRQYNIAVPLKRSRRHKINPSPCWSDMPHKVRCVGYQMMLFCFTVFSPLIIIISDLTCSRRVRVLPSLMLAFSSLAILFSIPLSKLKALGSIAFVPYILPITKLSLFSIYNVAKLRHFRWQKKEFMP